MCIIITLSFGLYFKDSEDPNVWLKSLSLTVPSQKSKPKIRLRNKFFFFKLNYHVYYWFDLKEIE